MNTLPDVLRVLELLEAVCCENALNWDIDMQKGEITFSAFCNDFFWWGSGDSEDVTLENLPVLAQAFTDVRLISPRHVTWGPLLFAARIRKLRPQGCAYPSDPGLAALFDACGPKREIDIGNPYNHPNDGGEYAYKADA